MIDCIFCKIINGEIASSKIYEDKEIIAFTPKEKEALGHTLIMPKKHYESIFDASDSDLKKLIVVIKKISLAIQKGLNAKGVNILNANGKAAQQSVPHLHFHILPRFENDGIDAWMKESKIIDYDVAEINSKIIGALK